MKFEGEAMEPWKAYWTVLRTYSLAWYEDPEVSVVCLFFFCDNLFVPHQLELTKPVSKQNLTKPVEYIALSKVREVMHLSTEKTKYKYSMQVVASNGMQAVSFDLTGLPGWYSVFALFLVLFISTLLTLNWTHMHVYRCEEEANPEGARNEWMDALSSLSCVQRCYV